MPPLLMSEEQTRIDSSTKSALKRERVMPSAFHQRLLSVFRKLTIGPDSASMAINELPKQL